MNEKALHTPDIGQRVVPLTYRDGRPMTQDGQRLFGGAEYYCRTCERIEAVRHSGEPFTLESRDLETILAAHDPEEDA